ncbi:hypothetical protein [Sphingobium nicotianae]|uniref:Uncharacterized protein n=1 Tax=Sphingobium nicotianae TaxID=2782607 RepID=A0A9X1DB03_9SPHN|nr:hypothetical protein [Sphingobium nicotianae]MBT2186730.1 hypothetical protein [Sphingobium nicotianae]
MRRLPIVLAACLAMGAADPPPDPAKWLQERLDRILARIGSAPGEVKIALSDASDVPWTHPAGTIQFPRALLVMAPSPEAVDGMLAMLLSYEEPGAGDARRPGGLSARAYGGSGLSNDRDDQQVGLSVGPARPPETKAQTDLRRDKAWQGARWNGQIGNCTAIQIDFLRDIGKEARLTIHGKPMIWPGSEFSRKVIAYLGAQAYPGGDRRCRTSETDPDFALVKQSAQAAD